MEQFINLVNMYMVEIFISSLVLFVLIFLIRSFKRNLLIARGQARFVLEQYDVATEKLHKWVSFFVFLLVLPLLAYVKFLNQ